MSQQFLVALAVGLLAAAVTGLGIFTIRHFAEWGQRKAPYFICFAAGVLIAASFLHLVPESLSMNVRAPIWMLAGFFGLHLFNRFFSVMVCERDPEQQEHVFGLVPMIGIGIHSFVDGIVHSVTFSVSIFTGLLSSAGMILHEFPEGIITYILLAHAGFRPRLAMLVAFISAGLSTPFGMLVSWPFISRIDEQSLGALLGLSAGALVYVGATHLLPKAEQEHGLKNLLALAGGILVAVFIMMTGH